MPTGLIDVNVGLVNGLVPSGKKPLPEAMLIEVHVTILPSRRYVSKRAGPELATVCFFFCFFYGIFTGIERGFTADADLLTLKRYRRITISNTFSMITSWQGCVKNWVYCYPWSQWKTYRTLSWHKNAVRISTPLWDDTGQRWIPLTNAGYMGLWCFLWCWI